MRTENRLSYLLLIPLALAWVCGPGAAAYAFRNQHNDPGMVYVDTLHPGQPSYEHADRPMPRTDANSLKAHEQLLAKRTQGRIDVYFMGDSITRRWGASDRQYADLLGDR